MILIFIFSDTTPPSVTIENIPSLSNKPQLTIAWKTDEPAKFQCTLDGIQQECGRGDRSSFPTRKLNDGEHLFELQATDRLGNKAPLVIRRFTIGTFSTFCF